MYPLTPALSPKRRGSRPCQFFVGIPQPTGRSHVSSHPNPLPKEEREPTVPICCRDPSAHREVACFLSPQPSPQRGEGADRANIFVGLPQPTGRSHVPSHPNPLPKEEREPTVPICCRAPSAHREVACSLSPQPSPKRGEGADRANIFVGILSPQGGRMFPSPQPSPQRGEGADRAHFCGDPTAMWKKARVKASGRTDPG